MSFVIISDVPFSAPILMDRPERLRQAAGSVVLENEARHRFHPVSTSDVGCPSLRKARFRVLVRLSRAASTRRAPIIGFNSTSCVLSSYSKLSWHNPRFDSLIGLIPFSSPISDLSRLLFLWSLPLLYVD